MPTSNRERKKSMEFRLNSWMQDNPARLAALLITFWRRNTRVLVLPPKIGTAGSGDRSGPVEVKQVGQQ